jgi:hypothetical protein
MRASVRAGHAILPRHLRQIFDRVIDESNLPMAWNAAGGLDEVDLHRALA